MITQAESVEIKRAVRRLIRAEVDSAYKGALDPIYHSDIESEVTKARAKFHSLISPNTLKPGQSRSPGQTMQP